MLAVPRMMSDLLFLAISICSSELNLTIASINAAAKIHKHLLHNILRQPNHFFDLIPIGRILSRFSTDLSTLDCELNFNVYEVIESTCIVSHTRGLLITLVVEVLAVIFKNYISERLIIEDVNIKLIIFYLSPIFLAIFKKIHCMISR